MLGRIMHDLIREEAKEIKQHLSIKGQDVDETVICELLESLDPNNHEIDRTQYIINMIMGNQDFDFQTSSDEAGPSIKIEHEGHNDTKKSLELDVHNSPTKSAETIDVSDSEDDRDYYYDFITNYDDTSIVNTIATRSSSCSVLDTGLEQIRDNVDQSTAEIKFLEENNNNDVIYMKSVTYEDARLSESPKPGCSKDLDNRSQSPEEYCYPCDVDELQIDTEQINTLLPNLDYDLIYKTLRNNQLAKNRIELTLWDLLPEERPSPQLAYKRKCIPYEIYSVKNKKNSDISQEKDVADTNMLLETKEQACARNEIKTIDIELKNKEFMTLENETEKMEIDITEDATATNNTDNHTNNQQTDMIPEAKLICLDTSANDVNVCKDVHDTKKSDSLENNSKNEELQSITNSAVPQKEINDISTTNLQSILQSIAIPNVAMSNTVVPNTPALCTVMPKTTVQSTIVPNTAAQSIVMPSIAVPNTTVPSIIMPKTAMSNTIVQSTAVLSTIMPSTAMPSTIVSSTAVPSTAMPRTLQIAMRNRRSGPATSRPAMPVLRPAKFTVHSAGASSAAPSSKHSVPILKPSKLKHVADRLENLMNARDTNNHTTMKTMNNMRAEVNKKEVHEALHFDNTFRRDFVHTWLKSSVKSAPPNKTLSNVKTEKMKFLEEHAVPITGSTKSSSAQLLNNLPKRNTLLSIQSEGATKYKEYLNIHLRKDSNVEVKNNLRQKDNTLQAYSTEMEKQVKHK